MAVGVIGRGTVVGVDELVEQRIERGHVLVDDVGRLRGLAALRRCAQELLVGVEVVARSARARRATYLDERLSW